MAFKVTDVIQETLSGARPSLFMAHINFPTGIGSGAAGAGLASRFLIKATSLPSSTLGIIELPFMGRKIKIAGDRTFEDWETTLINDEKMLVRSAIEKWSDGINGMQSNSTIFSKSMEYRSTADVTQLSLQGTPIRTYTFHNVWPSAVAAIEVGWETTDTISEFSVTWTYDYFVAKNGTDGIQEGLETLGKEVGASLRTLAAQVLVG
jgi:hypothetical protein